MGLPYFPFYPDRWLSSGKIDCLTIEQEGAYIRLLARAWGQPDCTLPKDETILMRWSRLGDANALRTLLDSCFYKVKNGWQNTTLFNEWLKAKDKHEKASQSAKVLWNKKKQSCERIANASETHSVGNANQNQNQNYIKTFSSDSIEYRLSETLLNLILSRKKDFKQPHLITWAKDIDKLIRIDKRTPAQIEKVMRWCQSDSFWQNNILSTSKLRDKFDALELKMNGGGVNGSHQSVNKSGQPKAEPGKYSTPRPGDETCTSDDL